MTPPDVAIQPHSTTGSAPTTWALVTSRPVISVSWGCVDDAADPGWVSAANALAARLGECGRT
jgi:hypothetical protein